MSKIRFVCASRLSHEDFHSRTALGRSLGLFRSPHIELALYENNRQGLSAIYNHALERSAIDPAVLIFIHDDVFLCDFFWPGHLLQALKAFDIVGVAGNVRRIPGQPAWCFIDQGLHWDSAEHLSGTVAQGNSFAPARLSHFGPTGRQVKLLDGLFLATRSETLVSRGIRFDETFDFHFYDMDLCRQAEERGLRMGTWGISVIHESGGAFGTPAWRDGCVKYFEKWKT